MFDQRIDELPDGAKSLASGNPLTTNN